MLTAPCLGLTCSRLSCPPSRRPKLSQIIAACLAKLAQWIYVLASQDFPQFSKRLVGLEVGFDDEPNDRVRGLDYRRTSKNAHATYHGIEVHKSS